MLRSVVEPQIWLSAGWTAGCVCLYEGEFTSVGGNLAMIESTIEIFSYHSDWSRPVVIGL